MFEKGTLGWRLKPLPSSFGIFTVLEDLGTKEFVTRNNNKVYHRRAVFLCPHCYSPFEATVDNIKRGLTTKSCGCHKNTHGLTNTVLYSRWTSMQGRCYNPDKADFNIYGAKGVTVCEEWRTNFVSFYTWAIDNGFSPELVIDKDILCDKLNISPKLYSPDTCQWITVKENATYAGLQTRYN